MAGFYSPLAQQYGGWKPPLRPAPAQAPQPGAPPPSGPPSGPPPQPGAPQTFAQMQRAGQPRPPAPAYRAPVSAYPMPYPAPAPGGGPQSSFGPPPVPQAAAGAAPNGGYTNGSVWSPTPQNGYRPVTSAVPGQPGWSAPGYGPAVSTGGSTVTGPGAQPGPQTGPQPQPPPVGANPFTAAAPGGSYGATPPVAASQQQTANDMGSAVQNLLLGSLQNPNPYASSPLLGTAASLAQAQGQEVNPYLTSGLVGGAESAILGQLRNPNPYNATNVQQMMSVLQQPILEQQQQQIQAVNADAARRGIFDSSIAEGNLKDVDTAAGRAQLSIADTLAQQIAQAQLAGTNSAIANAGGLEGQLAGQWQTGTNSAIGNLAGLESQQFGQDQAARTNAIANLLGYSGQTFNQGLQSAQMNLAQQQAQAQDYLTMLGLT